MGRMSQSFKEAVDFVTDLFENGIEEFSKEDKTINNLGGAKLWRVDPPVNRTIGFNDDAFEEFIVG
ncbi:MAG: hypothetical protein ACXABY_34980, partial [Candidatus Thorarchaeota archaeon]